MRGTATFAVAGLVGLIFSTAAPLGCGSVAVTTFPNQIVAADGQPLALETIEEIVRDDDLEDEQKRSALRDLGLKDERLIDALLTL